MVKQNGSSSCYHSIQFSCASYFYSSRSCPHSCWFLHVGSYRLFCLPKQTAIMLCSVLPKIFLFMMWDIMVKAQRVTVSVCRFAFSATLFLTQMYSWDVSPQPSTEESSLGDVVLEKDDFVVSQQPDYITAQVPLQFQNYCLFSLHTINTSTQHTTCRDSQHRKDHGSPWSPWSSNCTTSLFIHLGPYLGSPQESQSILSNSH